MGQPAARLTDKTSHGIPLTGFPSGVRVLIGKMPAWCVGDVHVCPLVNGVQPHVGGSVALGSASVFIGGKPAARQGDTVIEPGGPAQIVTGAATVLIG
jgi:uncharacterized Zn-binding protein involved in type VI secretion